MTFPGILAATILPNPTATPERVVTSIADSTIWLTVIVAVLTMLIAVVTMFAAMRSTLESRRRIGALEEGYRALSTGVAAEATRRLVSGLESGKTTADRAALISSVQNDVQSTLSAAMRSSTLSEPKRLEQLRGSLERLSPEAKALISIIADTRRHLNAQEYTDLSAIHEYEDALSELRAAGLLVPLVHDGTGVYYFPPGMWEKVKNALTRSSRPAEKTMEEVKACLNQVGYTERHAH